MSKQNLKDKTIPIFPFTAIVGQEEMKLALELNVIDSKICGVMIMGDRGTGKSTTIRAIASVVGRSLVCGFMAIYFFYFCCHHFFSNFSLTEPL